MGEDDDWADELIFAKREVEMELPEDVLYYFGKINPLLSASRISSSASATVWVTGFSRRTWQPALKQSLATAKWYWVGTTIETRSTSGRTS